MALEQMLSTACDGSKLLPMASEQIPLPVALEMEQKPLPAALEQILLTVAPGTEQEQ